MTFDSDGNLVGAVRHAPLPPGAKAPWVFVDADSIAYSAGYCEHDAEMRMSVKGYHKRILEATGAHGATYFVESPDGKANYRHQVAVTKGYKSGRKGKDKPPFMVDAKRYMKQELGAQFVVHMESEDAATISAYEYGRASCFIAAIDKDTHCHAGRFYDYRTDTVLEIDADYADWHLCKQLLMGDSVDSIPGLAGVGSKRAEGILESVAMGQRQEAVAAAYIERGHGYAYLLEQARLVYILHKRGEVYSPLTPEAWEALGGTV